MADIEKELKEIQAEIEKLKKIEARIQDRYEDMLKKEEAYLGEINEAIEKELTVIVLGTVKKTINKETTALKQLRKHVRSQVRKQVEKETQKAIDALTPELKKTIKDEVKKVSLDIINQLKRQTGKQLEKEVVEQVKQSTSALIEQKDESERKAIIDPLTTAFNRRYFETKLEDEIGIAKRFRANMFLLMFDIDYFKKINDTYGHQAGDTVLQEIVVVVKNCISSTDSLCRYGGEEFTVILPETKIDEAIDV
ncbi:MAG: diguanylate cyclase, partial [Spirochaetia bacterium]|nr:diguanylate cyclase [Spirochaetia bacterium]